MAMCNFHVHKSNKLADPIPIFTHTSFSRAEPGGAHRLEHSHAPKAAARALPGCLFYRGKAIGVLPLLAPQTHGKSLATEQGHKLVKYCKAYSFLQRSLVLCVTLNSLSASLYSQGT